MAIEILDSWKEPDTNFALVKTSGGIKWPEVAEYCDNDVIATEAVFNDRKADWTARQILADVAGMTVNDTTNSLTTRIIFGDDKNPQREFNYRFMSDIQNL